MHLAKAKTIHYKSVVSDHCLLLWLCVACFPVEDYEELMIFVYPRAAASKPILLAVDGEWLALKSASGSRVVLMLLWEVNSGQQHSLGCHTLCQGKADSLFDTKQSKSLQLWLGNWNPFRQFCAGVLPPLSQGQSFLFASTSLLLSLTATQFSAALILLSTSSTHSITDFTIN